MKLKNLSVNILLLLTSLYTPLFLFSLYSYFSPKNIIRLEQAREANEMYPQRILAVKKGFMPTFYPAEILKLENSLEKYPIGSLPNTNSYLGNEGYGMITYKTDRFGLRNPDKKWENLYGQSNIFILGDSFAHGACVPAESTIPIHIEKVTKINTINLAMGGNTPYEYMAILKSIVNPIVEISKNINKVIIIFYPNDNIPLYLKKEELLNSASSIVQEEKNKNVIPSKEYINEITSFIETNYPMSRDEIISEIQKKHKISKRRNHQYKQSSLYYILTLYPIREKINILLKNPQTNLTSQSFPKFDTSISKRSILELSNICTNKCKPYIAYIPNSIHWKPDPRAEKYKREIEFLSNSLKIPFIDGSQVIDNRKLSNYAPKGHHLSKKGYKKISDLISDQIKDKE